MKKFTILFTFILSLSTFCAAQHEAGDFGLLAEFHGLSNISFDAMNKGIGIRYFLADPLSLRMTFGGTVNSGVNEYKEFTMSGALLWSFGNSETTEGYLGPQVFYNHQDPNVNTYSIGGVIGGAVFPMKNFSLGYEHEIAVSRAEGTTTVVFGATNGKIIASFFF